MLILLTILPLPLNNVNKHLNDTVITAEYFKVFETEIQPTSFQHCHYDEKVHRTCCGRDNVFNHLRLVVYWRPPANESPLRNTEVGFCTLVSFFWKNTPENVELSEFVFSLHLLIIFILYASMWSHYMFLLFCQKGPTERIPFAIWGTIRKMKRKTTKAKTRQNAGQ